MKELAEDFEITIIDWLKNDDENVTNLAYILAKKATTLQLLQTDVINSRIKELEEENNKLHFMIKNALGYEDMVNDCL